MNSVFGAGIVKKAVEVRFHCVFRVRSFKPEVYVLKSLI